AALQLGWSSSLGTASATAWRLFAFAIREAQKTRLGVLRQFSLAQAHHNPALWRGETIRGAIISLPVTSLAMLLTTGYVVDRRSDGCGVGLQEILRLQNRPVRPTAPVRSTTVARPAP